MQKHHKDMKLQGSSQKRQKKQNSLMDMQHDNKECHMITEICNRNTRRLEETTKRLLMTIKRWTHKKNKTLLGVANKIGLKWPQRGTQDQKRDIKELQSDARGTQKGCEHPPGATRRRRDEKKSGRTHRDASLDACCFTKPLFSYGTAAWSAFFSCIHFHSCL